MEQHPSILDTHPYLRQTLELVSDKWITAIIYVLSRGTRRYGELQREIGGVSQRMLTRTLRNLERDGLVKREESTVPSLTVEYSLTPLGETLVEPLRLLCQWSVDHFDQVITAREDNHGQELLIRQSNRLHFLHRSYEIKASGQNLMVLFHCQGNMMLNWGRFHSYSLIILSKLLKRPNVIRLFVSH